MRASIFCCSLVDGYDAADRGNSCAHRNAASQPEDPGQQSCRCMRQFKTRSTLLRHWECKLEACQVDVAEGGIDVARNALIDMAQKRTYDASRRCKGFAAVTKLKQYNNTAC
jgi:hypothetical protein